MQALMLLPGKGGDRWRSRDTFAIARRKRGGQWQPLTSAKHCSQGSCVEGAGRFAGEAWGSGNDLCVLW
jgi:hypothetical protein